MNKLKGIKINGIEIKKIKKFGLNIVKNKYFTYFIAIITLFFVTETLCNQQNNLLLGLKSLFDNNIIKFVFLICAVYIGYFNQTLGILLVINFFFLINIQEKIEFFSNNLPDLIKKNNILKYNKYFKNSNQKSKELIKNNDDYKNNKTNQIENKNVDKNDENKIVNPIISNNKDNIKLTKSEEENIENNIKNEVDNILKNEYDEFKKKINSLNPQKKKLYEKYYKLHKNDNKLNHKNDSLYFSTDNDINVKNKKSLKKHKITQKNNETNKNILKNELKKIEESELEELKREQNLDDTLESEIKNSKLETKKNLEILENLDDDDSSSSDSSGSSSESSSDSEREYNDISMSEAREHVLNKIRNKMKKDYVKDN